jgi:hypothetical protein
VKIEVKYESKELREEGLIKSEAFLLGVKVF